ncbi:hypothetical protein A1507_21570 [Methylomonas koyamae]|uniref:Uncharacterized protein n=1 Tax=Methylomonas koyamae TaxID=702114 RepID=A0A177MZC1_9GAMM|nr:encapsulin [Methylomonas koyamae]OAI10633.1 hypothetical protein A1507_21570 [Methylomonas koyamae]
MAIGNNEFNWDAYQKQANDIAKEVAKEHRMMRPLFNLYAGNQGAWTRNIVRNKINTDLKNKIISVSIDKDQNLTPAILTCDVKIEQEQFGDLAAYDRAVKEAAYQIAKAEDALLLLGNLLEAKNNLLGPVKVKHLKTQDGLLSKIPEPLKPGQSVADSIRQGFRKLIKNGRKGSFVAIVSEELYSQATADRENRSNTEYSEFNKVIIQEGGFHYSEALEGRTGVIMSLSGESISVAVPLDIKVEILKVEGDAYLQVVEKIRLVIDIEEAVVPLENTSPNPPA